METKIETKTEQTATLEKGKKIKVTKISHGGGFNVDGPKPGDEGTIVDITRLPNQLGGNRQIWVRWERLGYRVAIIEGEDAFTVLD